VASATAPPAIVGDDVEELDVTSEVAEATTADVIVAKVEELLVEVGVGDW
jgi:hypothetical protein